MRLLILPGDRALSAAGGGKWSTRENITAFHIGWLWAAGLAVQDWIQISYMNYNSSNRR